MICWNILQSNVETENDYSIDFFKNLSCVAVQLSPNIMIVLCNIILNITSYVNHANHCCSKFCDLYAWREIIRIIASWRGRSQRVQLRFCEHSLRWKLVTWAVRCARCITSVYTECLTFRFSLHITTSSSSSSRNEHAGLPIFRQSIKKSTGKYIFAANVILSPKCAKSR